MSKWITLALDERTSNGATTPQERSTSVELESDYDEINALSRAVPGRLATMHAPLFKTAATREPSCGSIATT
jgi:hypothetical protein